MTTITAILDFWLDESRAREVVRQGRGPRSRQSANGSAPPTSGRRRASVRRLAPSRRRAAWPSSSSSTSFRATCSAVPAGPMQPMPRRAAWPNGHWRGISMAEVAHGGAADSSCCRSSTARISPTKRYCVRPDGGTDGRGQNHTITPSNIAILFERFGRFPHRNTRARPRDDGRRSGLPGRTRLRILGHQRRRRGPQSKKS